MVAAEFAENAEVRELMTALRLQWEEEIKEKMAAAVAQVRQELEERCCKQMAQIKEVRHTTHPRWSWCCSHGVLEQDARSAADHTRRRFARRNKRV